MVCRLPVTVRVCSVVCGRVDDFDVMRLPSVLRLAIFLIITLFLAGSNIFG